MSSHRTYSFIYSVQRTILLIFYTTTVIALGIPLIWFVMWLFPDKTFPIITVLVLYILLAVVFGAAIHVISFIPFNLANAFDPVKNDIASGALRNPQQLGTRITRFTTDFFRFSFLDVSHAFIQLEGQSPISHENLDNIKSDLKELGIAERARVQEGVAKAGTIRFMDKEHHLYLLPIRFGERYLGYLGLLSERRISKFFRRFLLEYEDNFLDDQIMHVLPKG